MDDKGKVYHETSPDTLYTRSRTKYIFKRALTICNNVKDILLTEVKDLIGSGDYKERPEGFEIGVTEVDGHGRIEVKVVDGHGRKIEWSIEHVEFEPGYFDDADGTLPDQNQADHQGNFLHFAAFKI